MIGLAALLAVMAAPDGGARTPAPADAGTRSERARADAGVRSDVRPQQPSSDPATRAERQAARLSASDCERLIDTIVVLSVAEMVAKDPEVQQLPPEKRVVTAKLVRRRALADPDLDKLKLGCPDRYTRTQERCILAAKTMDDVDACSR